MDIWNRSRAVFLTYRCYSNASDWKSPCKFQGMKRMSSFALRWILVASLTVSPLLAYPLQEGNSVAPQEPVVRILDENQNPIVVPSILSTILMDSPGRVSANGLQNANAAATGQVSLERTARELGAPTPAAPNDQRAEPGGKTWQQIIVAALIAGGVIALILLLRGHKDSPRAATAPAAPRVQSPPPVTGTILTPGTPSVSSPR